MNEEELLNEVIHTATFAADDAVLGRTFRTRAEEIRAAVAAAFQLAAGNGLIRITPRAEWPKYIALSPPYEPWRPLAADTNEGDQTT